MDLPYHTLSPLTPNSLIKNTWSFLSRHGLKQKHDIKVEGFRQGDQPIMQVLFNKGVTINELVQINRYQLFLNVYYASKILMGYGNQVRPFLLQRAKGPVLNQFTWFRQGTPSSSDWEAWNHHIWETPATMDISGWHQPRDKVWWYNSAGHKLFKKAENSWLSFSAVFQSRRNGYFQVSGTTTPTMRLYPAHVAVFRTYYILHGWREESELEQGRITFLRTNRQLDPVR